MLDAFTHRAWLCGLALTTLLCACGGKPDSAAPAPTVVHEGGLIKVSASSPLHQSLLVAPVSEESVERPINVPAVIEADPARLVRLVPPLAGRILRLHKQLGDAVQRGDALVTLDSADMAQAFSDAGKAQAQLVLTEHNLKRQQDLSDAGISARKDLEQAQSDQAQARAEAERAGARLSQLGSSLQAHSGRQYTLTSPIPGRVIELSGAAGGFWNDTSAAVMTVADLSSVWVSASVQEKDLAAVFVGQSARFSLDAYPGETFTGQVKYVGEVLDPDTRTVKVRIAVANPAGRFRPGMFAKAVFQGPAHTAVVVPAAALVQSGFNTRVFVEQAPGAYEARIVKAGTQLDGERIEVLSGLKAGERIVVKNGMLLND